MNECKLRNQGLSFLQILHVTASRAHRTFFFSYLFLVLFLFAQRSTRGISTCRRGRRHRHH